MLASVATLPPLPLNQAVALPVSELLSESVLGQTPQVKTLEIKQSFFLVNIVIIQLRSGVDLTISYIILW